MIILLAASFAVWGISDVFRGGRSTSVASVGDLEIPTERFERDFNRELQRLKRRFPELTREQANLMGVSGQVLSRLIGEALLSQEADRLGVAAADPMVRRRIGEEPAFQRDDGSFDRAAYEGTLRQSNLTVEDYEALIRGELRRDQVQQTMVGQRAAPRALTEALFRFRHEQRIAEIAIVPRHAASDVGTPDEATLAAFHQEHEAQFTAPEYRSVTYVELTPEGVVGEIELSDEDVYAEYELRIGEFGAPEQRAVDQIRADDETLIRDGVRMLAQGQSFDVVMDALTTRGATSLSIGAMERNGLPAEAGDVVFGLGVGEASEPVKTPFGWHLFRVTEITPARTRSFEDVRDDLQREMSLSLAADSLYRLSTVLEDELAGGASLEQAVAAINVEVSRPPAFDRRGLDAGGAPALDSAELEAFLELTFETDEGFDSPLTETLEGNYFIVRVDAVQPPQLKPLEAIRNQVIAVWRLDALSNAAKQAAEQLAERVRGGQALADAAAAQGYEVATTEPLLRTAQSTKHGLSPEMIEGLFSQPAAAPEPVVGEMSEGFAVALLRRVAPAEPASSREEMERLSATLGRARSSDILALYQFALQNEFGVAVNTQLLQSLFATP